MDMKAAAYVRVSTEEQSTGLSLEAQERACREYADRQGWQVATVYQDIQSGLDADRPGWQRLLSDARRKRFDAVVVYRLDRFGRDPADAFPAVKELAKFGIALHSATEGNDHFVQGLLLLLAQEESRRTSARVQLVMKGLAQQGKWLGRAPLGYEIVQAPDGKGATLQPSSQAPLVRRLFELYATGASYRDLQREAGATGLTVEGRIVDRQRIQHILRNPVYVGRVVYGRRAHGKFTGEARRPKDEWLQAPGVHEPIVNKETWQRVQARLASNRNHNTAGEITEYLLTSYIYCGHCGGRMHGMKLHRYNRKGKRTGRVTYTYRCYNGVQLDACGFKYASGPRVDEALKEALRNVPLMPEAGALAACQLIEDALGGGRARQQQIKRLKAERARHEKRRVAMTRDYYDKQGAAGAIPDDVFIKLIGETEAAIKAIDEELQADETVDERKLMAALAILEAPIEYPTDQAGWRALVERWVDRVTVRSITDIEVVLKPHVQEVAEAVKRGEEMPPEIRAAVLNRMDRLLGQLRCLGVKARWKAAPPCAGRRGPG
jgi:DNA invertase Pin-like site-specific DNA recombinase